MSELPVFIPESIGLVMGWLGQEGISPAGAPFLRYHVIDMPGAMDVELGFPVGDSSAGKGPVTGGSLPAGRYASLVYRGVANGFAANKALIDWVAESAGDLDSHPTAGGDAFAGRCEIFLTNPADEPDPSRWDTEVIMRLKD
jgi:hypothetical protein